MKVSYGGDEEDGEVEEGEQDEEEEDENESRMLTQEEIWDDSALIDAWNSASAEYEVCPPTHPSSCLTLD